MQGNDIYASEFSKTELTLFTLYYRHTNKLDMLNTKYIYTDWISQQKTVEHQSN